MPVSPHRRHARAARRHPARADEHVDDDQRDGGLAARALRRGRRRAGRAAQQAHGHHPERHHQGIPVARHLRVSARTVAAADQGHDRLLSVAKLPKWNPTNVCSYHLQEAGATPVQELAYALATAHGRARRGEGLGRGEARGLRQRGRAHLLLRQRGPPLRHRDVQDARVRRALGRDHARALRRHRRQAPAVPLRRAGQLAGAHRAAAGEQRLPHPARDAGRDAVEEGPRPRRAAARLERGARPAAPVGPAVVAAHAADPGLRDAICSSTATSSTARPRSRQGRTS